MKGNQGRLGMIPCCRSKIVKKRKLGVVVGAIRNSGEKVWAIDIKLKYY